MDRSNQSDLQVSVLFFGQLAEQFGRVREVGIPAEGCTVAELRQLLIDAKEPLASVLRRDGIRAAIDQEIVSEDAMIVPGREIAFFAPVSGG